MKTDYELILLAAFRYALGRKTYIVGAVVDAILEKERSEFFIKTIQGEIWQAIETGNAGMECDIRQWERLLSL